VDVGILGGLAWLLGGIAMLAGAILQRWQSGICALMRHGWRGSGAVLLFLLVQWQVCRHSCRSFTRNGGQLTMMA